MNALSSSAYLSLFVFSLIILTLTSFEAANLPALFAASGPNPEQGTIKTSGYQNIPVPIPAPLQNLDLDSKSLIHDIETTDVLAVQSPNFTSSAECDHQLSVASVTAQGDDGNVPSNVIDNNLNTRWSNLGIGSWIQLDLGEKKNICSVDIAWYRGDMRQNNFVISVSDDGSTFTQKHSGTSSGTTASPEKYTLPSGTEGRYVRITVNGNTENEWASITEIAVFGDTSGSTLPPQVSNPGPLYHRWQNTAGSSVWSAWTSLGGAISSNPSAINNADGRLEVFAVGANGKSLYHRWQTSPGSSTSWSAWTSLGGTIAGSPAVERNSDGRLEVFAVGANGKSLYHRWQTSPGSSTSWSAWTSLGGSIKSNPAVIANQDGRLEVFAVGSNNQLYHRWQTSPGSSTSWSAWTSLGGTIAGSPAVERNSDGRLEVFAVGANGKSLYHRWQTSPGSSTSWSAWTSLGGVIANTKPAALANEDGRLGAFAVGDGGGSSGGGSTTRDGVTVPFKIKGQWDYEYETDERDGGARYNMNAAGTSLVMVGYFRSSGGSDDVSMKILGGRHSDSVPYDGCIYDPAVAVDSGEPRLRAECPHPDYTGNLDLDFEQQGVSIHDRWVGFMAVALQEQAGVRIQVYQDQGNNDGSQPANQWVKVLEFFDDGTKVSGIEGADRFPLRELPDTAQNTFRIDETPGLQEKWLAIAEIDTSVLSSVQFIQPLTADSKDVTTETNAAVDITLSGTDPNNDPITFSIVDQPMHGQLSTISAQNIVTYIPTTGYVGPDSFTYVARDSKGATSINKATVSITVSSTDGGTNDKFGIKKIYPTKPGGEEWYMNMDDPQNDPRTSEPSMSRNSDGSWRVTSGQVRYGVFTSSGYQPDNVVTDHSILASRGYMQSPNDWKNVEMTGQVKYNSGGDNEWTWYARGGRHTGSGSPEGCEGVAYKGSLSYTGGDVRWAKEQGHVSYVFQPWRSSLADGDGKFVGFKVAIYNMQLKGETVTKMESWVDPNNDNQWQKVYDFIDRGGWGSEGGECNGEPDQTVTWGGPIASFRWDNGNSIDIKNLSVREITPPT